MTKKILCLLCALLFTLASIQVLPAEEEDRLFPAFLFNLVKKHKNIETAAMPGVEVHNVPGMEDAAVYMLNFKNQEDLQIFLTALSAENIPYAARPNFELQVILFSPDMIQFIWANVLGL